MAYVVCMRCQCVDIIVYACLRRFAVLFVCSMHAFVFILSYFVVLLSYFVVILSCLVVLRSYFVCRL